jgi:hypothetical protein
VLVVPSGRWQADVQAASLLAPLMSWPGVWHVQHIVEALGSEKPGWQVLQTSFTGVTHV